MSEGTVEAALRAALDYFEGYDRTRTDGRSSPIISQLQDALAALRSRGSSDTLPPGEALRRSAAGEEPDVADPISDAELLARTKGSTDTRLTEADLEHQSERRAYWRDRAEAAERVVAAARAENAEAHHGRVTERTRAILNNALLDFDHVPPTATGLALARSVAGNVRDARASLDSSERGSSDTRLTEALRELEQAARRLDVALAECDSKALKIADHPDGDEWVGSYFLRCGPWHRVLGCRSQLAYGIGKAKAALADARADAPPEGQA